MPLPILNSAEDVCAALRARDRRGAADAQVQVHANSPGHFEIEVVSTAFAGKSMVQQQQLVYGAIKELMAGDGAPVHAVDRLLTRRAVDRTRAVDCGERGSVRARRVGVAHTTDVRPRRSAGQAPRLRVPSHGVGLHGLLRAAGDLAPARRRRRGRCRSSRSGRPGRRKLASMRMPAGMRGRSPCGSQTPLGIKFASGGMNGWCAGLNRSNAPVSYIT